MSQENQPNSTNSSIQDYFSMGYIYLLILGIINDSFRYGFLDINFINYSTVLDVLMSPLVYLTQDIKRPLMFLVGGIISIAIVYGGKWNFERNKDKEAFRKLKNFAKLEKNYANFQPAKAILIYMAMFIFGVYLGFGIGGGKKLSTALKAGELEVDTQLTFTNNDTLNVKRIGHNSQYFFYAEENATEVTIMPIQGNILKIRNLEEE